MTVLTRLLGGLGIGQKILLAIAIPLLALVYFAVGEVWRNAGIRASSAALAQEVELATISSALVHETQKERGRTAAFYGAGSADARRALDQQRQAVDKRAATLRDYLSEFDTDILSPTLQAALNKAVADLGQMRQRRQQIDAGQIGLRDAIGYYTALNGDFISLVAGMSRLSKDAAMAFQIAAYSNFLQSKERAGIERAVLSNTFAADGFGPGMLARFHTLVAEQNAFMEAFRAIATPEHAALLDRAMDEPAVASVDRLRAIAVERSASGGFGVDAGEWFATITRKIEALKSVEDALAESLMREAGEKRDAASTALLGSAVLGLPVLVFSLMLGLGTARPIGEQLGRAVEVLNALAEGDLSRRIGHHSEDEIGDMSRALDVALERLGNLVTHIDETAASLSSSAAQLNATSDVIANSAQSQAGMLQNTASSMQEITSTVQSSAGNAAEANSLASEAVKVAERGGEVASNAVGAMSEIGEASSQIAQINNTIDEIAFQTNLLALNAAVEAARAGDAGRGFAVVAGEVRGLAGRATDAARHITQLVNDTTDRVEAGSTYVNRSGSSLEDIVGSISQVADLIADLSRATNEQSEAVAMINDHITTMDQHTRDNATQASELSSTAQNLTDKADHLRNLVNSFKVA